MGLPPGPIGSLVWGTAVVYCAIGAVGTVAAVRAVAGLRVRAALLLRATGVGALLYLPPLLCAIWIVAARTNAIPAGEWGVNEGLHGPWRHAHDLRGALLLAFALPETGFVTAIAAYLIRPTSGAVGLAAASVASWLALARSHSWLID